MSSTTTNLQLERFLFSNRYEIMEFERRQEEGPKVQQGQLAFSFGKEQKKRIMTAIIVKVKRVANCPEKRQLQGHIVKQGGNNFFIIIIGFMSRREDRQRKYYSSTIV